MKNGKTSSLMKNRTIILLVNNGVLSATAHDLDAANAYKLLGFKRAVKKQLDEIIEREKEIKDDPKADELREELHNEEVKLDCKTMPYGAFHALAKENRALPVFGQDGRQIGTSDPFSAFENELENVLWVAPEE